MDQWTTRAAANLDTTRADAARNARYLHVVLVAATSVEACVADLLADAAEGKQVGTRRELRAVRKRQ